MRRRWAMAIGAGGLLLLLVLLAWGGGGPSPTVTLLNVSYDPTRELWRDLNREFVAAYEAETGTRLVIRQSHGGSSAQARAVIDGLEADVVTLAVFSDTDAIRKRGLLAEGWQQRLPNDSLPYFSTIVFVVRKGNPKAVRDWPDLAREGVQVITPNPKTSGNGKLSFLAAWGAVLKAGGSEADAAEFVGRLYRNTPVLDTGARGSNTTFAQKKIGDVHLTWENEAYLEVAEAGGELEIVYPEVSIRAEPFVAVVDASVDRKGTRAAAEAYLKFMYRPEGQEVIARHHYRPIDPEVQKRHAHELPPVELFPITDVAAGWDDAQKRFFAEGGVFDRIYQPTAEPPKEAPKGSPPVAVLWGAIAVIGLLAVLPLLYRPRQRRILPGFHLSLGFTNLYLAVLVLIPLAACILRAASLSPEQFVAAAWTPRAQAAYALTFGASLVASILSIGIGLLIAWVLVRYDFPLKRLFDALVDLPFALPTAVAGLVFSSLYAENGWLGQFLTPLGVQAVYSRLGIVLALTFIGFPFVVRTVQPVLESLDAEVEEASASLGATRGQTFRRVILPSLYPALVTGFALAFARALGEYGSIIFVSGNIRFQTEIAPVLIVERLEDFAYAEATAIAVVLLAASFSMLVVINLLERRARGSEG